MTPDERDELQRGDKFFARVPRSHRKLDKVISRLGGKPQFYYSFRFDGDFILVTAEQFERLRPLVTRARVDFDKLLQCWDGS